MVINYLNLNLNFLKFIFKEPLDSEVSMLCVGMKFLSVQNSITNIFQASIEQQFKKQYIIACATPICIFFIDLNSL